MLRSKFVRDLFIFVILALVLIACQPQTSTGAPTTAIEGTTVQVVPTIDATATMESTPPIAKSTLTFGVWGTSNPNNFCTLSPTTGVDEIWRNRFLGATLYTLNENYEWIPNLAKSYESNPDGTSYTFRLDPNAKWHDGASFTSQDVVFTFDLLLNPEIGSYGALFRDIVDKVEAVDDYTVVFHMKRPIIPEEFSTKSDYWNLVQGWIPVPQHILSGYAPSEICNSDWGQKNYVGLGPFVVADFVPDDHVLYKPYQDYHLGPSQLDEITIRFSTDPANIFSALKAGEYDMAQITPEFINDVKPEDNLLLPPDSSLIAVNTSQTKWPPDDPYVRQALVEPKYETFVPYRETLEEVKNIIGDAALFPLHSETSAAIDSLQNVIAVEFNLPRTVKIEDGEHIVLWAPIGPESAQLFGNVSNVDEFWDIVKENGRLNVGIVVIDNVPAAAWAYVTEEGQREIRLIGPDDKPLKTYEMTSEDYGTAAPVEIPTAAIILGTSWCRGQIWGVWFWYPCGW